MSKTAWTALLMLVGGCVLVSEDGLVKVQTDEARYTVAAPSMINLKVTNRSDNTIYYICTGQVFLEARDSGGDLLHRWMVHGFEECYGPGPIHADDTFMFVLDTSSPPWDPIKASLSDDLTYRFSIDLYEDKQFERLLDTSERRSNPFLLTR